MKGPADLFPCPDRLSAHVVEPGASPRIHGYDVDSDLAKSFTFGEVILLALTEREPEPRAGRAFEAAMTLLSAVSVAETPAHAAVLAQICGAPADGVAGASAIAAASRASALVAAHLNWLRNPAGDPPPGDDAPEARAGLRSLIELELLDRPLSREAAAIAVLFACGLVREEQLIAAITIASLPSSLAEGFAVKPLSFAEYPLRLPEIEYREP